MATLDGRVKEFICEKARQIMLPISCIAFEARAFATTITSGLNVSTDNDKFIPTEQTVSKYARRFRQQLKLDPEDAIAIQKQIDQDTAKQPGMWQLHHSCCLAFNLFCAELICAFLRDVYRC